MIPIGIVVLISYIIIWAVHVGDKTEANASVMTDLQIELRQINRRLYKIEERLHIYHDGA